MDTTTLLSTAAPEPGTAPSPSVESPELVASPAPIDVRHTALTMVAIATTIGLFYFMQAVLIPMVLAALLFYALDPVVDWLSARRVPRSAGALAALLAVVCGVSALTYALEGQAASVITQLPDGARRFRQAMQRTPGSGPGTLDMVQEAAAELQKPAEPPTADATEPVRVQVRRSGPGRCQSAIVGVS